MLLYFCTNFRPFRVLPTFPLFGHSRITSRPSIIPIPTPQGKIKPIQGKSNHFKPNQSNLFLFRTRLLLATTPFPGGAAKNSCPRTTQNRKCCAHLRTRLCSHLRRRKPLISLACHTCHGLKPLPAGGNFSTSAVP